MNAARKTVKNELLQQLMSDHSWAKSYKIEVSPGFIPIVDNYLKEVEEILGPNPEIDFFRIAEGYLPESANDEVSALFKRKLILICDPTESTKARDHALDLVSMNAVSASVEVCFQCGHALKVMNLSDDKIRARYTFLPEATSPIFTNSTVCLTCAEVDYDVAQAKQTKNNLVPENATMQEIEHMLAMAQAELNSRKQIATQPGQSAKTPSASFSQRANAVILAKAPRKKPHGLTHMARQEVVVFSDEQVDEILESYEDAPREQAQRVRGLVKRIKRVSPIKPLTTIPDQWIDFCADLERRFPNFSEVIRYIRNQMALSAKSNFVVRIKPMILVGNPGCGKTEFALTLAKELNTILQVIDISSSQSGSPLTGSESHWSNSQPGMLWTTLVIGNSGSPIILLDEIDKARGRSEYNPLAALHSLLEPRQAARWSDLCIPELNVDARNVIWIATANTIDTLERPLVDRFNIFNIADPTVEHMRTIVVNQYKKFINDDPAGYYFNKKIKADVVAELSEFHPRKVRKILDGAFGLAAFEDRDYLTVDDIRSCDVGAKPKPGIGFMSEIGPTN